MISLCDVVLSQLSCLLLPIKSCVFLFASSNRRKKKNKLTTKKKKNQINSGDKLQSPSKDALVKVASPPMSQKVEKEKAFARQKSLSRLSKAMSPKPKRRLSAGVFEQDVSSDDVCFCVDR
jgi:hypothetical protein